MLLKPQSLKERELPVYLNNSSLIIIVNSNLILFENSEEVQTPFYLEEALDFSIHEKWLQREK